MSVRAAPVRATPGSKAARLDSRLYRRESQLPESTQVRLHRAISWLRRAEAEPEDLDARFILLWIAFNAVYAKEFGFEHTEREKLELFISALLAVDDKKKLHQLLFKQFTGPIRTMIQNKYVYEPFWKAYREHDSSNQWEERFKRSTQVALRALMNGETGVVLSIVFDRLYVLRNQLIHGGATWNSSINRGQLKDGASILMALVPQIVSLMIDHPELDFGGVLYPPI